MLCLLGLTAALIWRLGSRWFGGLAAAVPPFVYLAAVPVTMHGGSFRADSMLAPLLMCATTLLASSERSKRDEWLAGAAIGVAAAVTVKVLLFAPMFLLLIIATRASPTSQPESASGSLVAHISAHWSRGSNCRSAGSWCTRQPPLPLPRVCCTAPCRRSPSSRLLHAQPLQRYSNPDRFRRDTYLCRT